MRPQQCQLPGNHNFPQYGSHVYSNVAEYIRAALFFAMKFHCWCLSNVVLNLRNPQMPFSELITQPVTYYPIPQNCYTPGAELGAAACWTSWGFCQVSVPGVVNWNFCHWIQARLEMDVHFPLNREGQTVFNLLSSMLIYPMLPHLPNKNPAGGDVQSFNKFKHMHTLNKYALHYSSLST